MCNIYHRKLNWYFSFYCTCNHCIPLTPSRPFLHTQDMYFVFVQLLSSGSAWFAIIIIVITCLFPDVVKKVFYRHLQPTSTQKSQVAWGGGGQSKTVIRCFYRLLLGNVCLPQILCSSKSIICLLVKKKILSRGGCSIYVYFLLFFSQVLHCTATTLKWFRHLVSNLQ